MLTSQGLTNDEGHPNDDVSSWVSKMLFRLSGYHHQWDLSNQIIHITFSFNFLYSLGAKSLDFSPGEKYCQMRMPLFWRNMKWHIS